jgi:hypothetical protein
MDSGATISKCHKFRYQLWRIWDISKPLALFVLLNPSTADGNKDDPTIRRLVGFCKQWQLGGFYVVNIYPFRTKSPTELKQYLYVERDSEYGEAAMNNRTYASELSKKCSVAVFGWGVHHDNRETLDIERYKEVLGDIPVVCLGMTKNGHPRHPLYVPYSAALQEWPTGSEFNINSIQL